MKRKAELKERLKELFPNRTEHWYALCFKRLEHVKHLNGNRYMVWGDRKLGDFHPVYFVDVEDEGYKCSCATPTRSWWMRRKAETCTHAGAVALYILSRQEGLRLDAAKA
ncbi:MAG: hypothetical protein QXR81_08035 [Candidatus Nezhaarchaeales archaeon]